MLKTINKKIFNRLFKRSNNHINSKKLKNDRKIPKKNVLPSSLLFLVTSVIHPWNTEFNEQRYIDTLDTISSIRDKCPQADILLIDGGDTFEKLDLIKSMVDKFLWVGDKKIKKSILNKNKGIGESALIRFCYPMIKKYEFVIKISGRYKLTSEFNVAKMDQNVLNFKNYYTYAEEENYGLSKYIEGSHSTRLYGVPARYYRKWKRALILSIPFMHMNLSIEYILPMLMDECQYCYHSKIGVTGNVAGRGEIINE